VHLLDFDQDIYGANMSVSFCQRVRSEQKFDSVQALQAQIRSDIEHVRTYFTK